MPHENYYIISMSYVKNEIKNNDKYNYTITKADVMAE